MAGWILLEAVVGGRVLAGPAVVMGVTVATVVTVVVKNGKTDGPETTNVMIPYLFYFIFLFGIQ